MHTFQPYPVETVEINPFELVGKRWGVLTAEKDGKSNAMTISWGGMGCLWNKNVATVYVRESRYTKEFLDASDIFSVTFFDEHYRSSLKYLGAVSGRNEDKIKNARLNVNHYRGIPFIDEGNFVLILRKIAALDMEDTKFFDPNIRKNFYADGDMHTQYIGEVLELLAR